MPNQSIELAQFVTTELRRLADPAKAPQLAASCPEMRRRFSPADQKSSARNVLALWKLPHREERYSAIAYARQHPEFSTPASMPLYERMIREGAWWDFVDEIAVNLTGA